ncbi:protein Turandot A-like [Drosophila eugracilis]|uniref:protein Turandot A-like n=1 Tax=Drosophila eugracilis TaxID=29029 RepID=UPI0007E69283|nr:protein Turandot A-like [Drosophila eugracilis]
MNSSLSLMCFALVLISPLCLGYSDEQRQADSLRVAEIIRTSQDDDAKINNTQELLDIYRRLYPSLTPEDRESIDKFVNEHTDAILVDGVPAQGGRKTKFVGKVLSPAIKGVATGFFEELGAGLARIFTG